jgi:hypothetical protein
MKQISGHLFFAVSTCLIFSCCSARMNTYEFFTDLFKFHSDKTPYIAYQLLKANPLPQDVNFLIIPWSVVFDKNKLREVERRLQNFRINGGFTICLWSGDSLMPVLPLLKKVGIDCIFTPNATYEETTWNGIRIEAFPYCIFNSAEPSPKKDILYSFIGLRSHPCRGVIFSMQHPENTVIIERKNWFLLMNQQNPQTQQMALQYKDVLSRSRFSLCPRGHEPSSFRFWESLQAGAIPVFISDAARLPKGFDWDRCIIRVAEKDISKIPAILAAIPPEQEESLRNACLEAYKLYSGENLVRVIREFYK